MGGRCIQTFQTFWTHLPAMGRVLARGGGSLKTNVCLIGERSWWLARPAKPLSKFMVITGREGRAVGNLKICCREGAEPSQRGQGPDDSTTESEGNCRTWVVGPTPLFLAPKDHWNMTSLHLLANSFGLAITITSRLVFSLSRMFTSTHHH